MDHSIGYLELNNKNELFIAGDTPYHGKGYAILTSVVNLLISKEGVRGLTICATKEHRNHVVKSVCSRLKEMGVEYSWHYGAVTGKDKHSIVVKVGETEQVFSIIGSWYNGTTWEDLLF